MNKLTKVGCSALCGSLAAFSAAHAGDLAVTGGADMTYMSQGGAVTGNPFGMASAVTFTGSGELDNGWTFDFVVAEGDAVAYIKELDLHLNFKSDQTHVWHVLPKGIYTVNVTIVGHAESMTKYMVPIQIAEFTEVVFVLPPNQMIPKFVALFLIACISMVVMICAAVVCRCCGNTTGNSAKWLSQSDNHNGSFRSSKTRTHHRPSHDGFQLLTRGGAKAKSLFPSDDDESEDEILANKSMKQYGLKMATAKVYHDELSSQSSEEDENSFLHIRQNGSNGRGSGIGIIGHQRPQNGRHSDHETSLNII